MIMVHYRVGSLESTERIIFYTVNVHYRVGSLETLASIVITIR